MKAWKMKLKKVDTLLTSHSRGRARSFMHHESFRRLNELLNV